MKKSDKNLRRKKPRHRVRGTPMFDGPVETNSKPKDLVKEPETSMDIARLLSDEIHKKWPDAQTPATLSGKHTKLTKELANEFDGQTVKSMIRLLVWDFEEIRKNKGFFPPAAHLNWPWIDQLYNYRHALASSVGTGITDATSRTSAYAQRYLNQKEDAPKAESKTDAKESMKDIAKRLLGQ